MAKVSSAVSPFPPVTTPSRRTSSSTAPPKRSSSTSRRSTPRSCCACPMPDGKVAHAEIKIGDSPVMLADASDEFKRPARVRRHAGQPHDLRGGRRPHLPRRRSPRAPRSCGRWSTSSTATAPARSSIRSGTCGPSPRTSRTSRPRRSTAAWRR